MKVVSVNTNGIRAAAKKGFFDWVAKTKPDIICIQETKCQQPQLTDPLFFPPEYHITFCDAQKKGYSGTAIYSRHQPNKVTKGIGWPRCDDEGRFLQYDFGKLKVISLYLPSGSSSEERQQAKFAFMDQFMPLLKSMRQEGSEYIICGDWNIAHKEIDLKNWKGNKKNSGFLPEERAWLTDVLAEDMFVDAFRELNQESEQYTWWSNRGQSWAKNVGWRIDYQIISPGLKQHLKSTSIYKDERFSDHAPLIIDYDPAIL